MPPDTNVKLREYIETQIGHVQAEHARYERTHEEKHTLEKAVRASDAEAVGRALELSAVELSRRLEMLNGEAARLHHMQLSYVPREVYEKQIDTLRTEVDRLRLVEANIRGQAIAYSVTFSLLVSVVFFILNKLL